MIDIIAQLAEILGDKRGTLVRAIDEGKIAHLDPESVGEVHS